MIRLYNTLTRSIEPFKPQHDTTVRMYTCGPTVYNYAHIGNLRTYVFEDILRRTLKYHGYAVTHVMNITDVGHLTDDADFGEDKMEKGSRREGKTAWEIAAVYTEAFQNDLKNLNILEPTIWAKATDHIDDQIQLVTTLRDKGYTYETDDGIYFDTTKISDYGKLAQLDRQTLKAGMRVEMGQKKNPHDFALWKFSKAGESRQMEWDAFGKKGFPGWHIECSAMSMRYLGEQFDIHCGGVDHISVHHTNEIAQSEAATGKKPWVFWWLHGEFLLLDEGKMAKSGSHAITLQTITEKHIPPLAYRYFLLQSHYRKQIGFRWQALEAAHQGLLRLRRHVVAIPETTVDDLHIMHEFQEAMDTDLNTAEALSVLWRALKENKITQKTVTRCDKILGLDLNTHNEETVPPEIAELLAEREKARAEKRWGESDVLRKTIENSGYTVEDTPAGQTIRKNY
ncbi:MAG TPA: cysteine--tRNA ligase [Candidatus Magasanikbacteria bacterium]|nr:MAG: cysteine--tRNA ligase [Candidatus Magasanikbacteria bacterium RIFCSPLOWO2_02_FULL_47_16]OGH80033.1 MAG: cysteine--tRNA ligase [Candidatus Magasanikbacteria bacterium RIFCSPHIGHO2_02_FULL_48_18]OGH83281.1 MAG: cysteine--tRNA ligase [Candidatus Magasanikbacteria bacterium RIFCSPLOWO2_12_FULL_47_9b]HAZ28488.1 cysteine--tRNA ligase [Candidatus Magasanikbacteria bacterium]